MPNASLDQAFQDLVNEGQYATEKQCWLKFVSFLRMRRFIDVPPSDVVRAYCIVGGHYPNDERWLRDFVSRADVVVASHEFSKHLREHRLHRPTVPASPAPA
ncbi:MAG: hypothetical protein H8E66_01505 [Planctomycetes bacterium]|nr:hypothetical protein [Planctomycetota bacterium]